MTDVTVLAPINDDRGVLDAERYGLAQPIFGPGYALTGDPRTGQWRADVWNGGPWRWRAFPMMWPGGPTMARLTILKRHLEEAAWPQIGMSEPHVGHPALMDRIYDLSLAIVKLQMQMRDEAKAAA